MRFHGVFDEILEEMTRLGIAKTKAEAVRLALFKFATDYGLVDDRLILKTLRAELAKKPLRPEAVLAEVERVKHETIS